MRARAGLAVAGLVGTLLSPPPAIAEEPAWELPELGLEALEPAVGEQIATLLEWTEARLAEPEAAAEARAEAVGELAQLLHAYDLTEPAESCYRRALELAPRDFRWPYLLAYLLGGAGRLEEATRLYERALAIEGRVPPALVRLGAAYRALGRPEAAERNLRQALELDPASSVAIAELGELLVDDKRYAEGIELLERALQMEPEANRLYYPLAMAHRAQGDTEEARRLLALAGKVGLRPADPLVDGLQALATGERVHLLRGRAAFAAGRYPEAAAEFRRAVEAKPDSIRALVNLGAALGAAGDREQAIAIFERAVELGPANVTAHYNLGTLYREAGDLASSLEHFREAVLYGPEDAASRLELATALRLAGRPGDALAHYDRAAELAPPGELARLGRAQALVKLGRLAEARRTLEAAHALIPSSGLIAQALSRVLSSCPDATLRDGERAVELAQAVWRARPEPFHAETLALALAESGRCAEAVVYQERFLEGLEAAGQPVPPRANEALAAYRAGGDCRPPAGSVSP